MAFSNFKSIKQVIRQYPLKISPENFLPDKPIETPAWFMENLNFSLKTQAVDENEFFFCENFIFPFLQLAWKAHHKKLKLWSHQTLTCDDDLSGEPDYFVSAWRDEVIDKLINTPVLAVVEAKKQDFESGWGQCLAEMIACQKLNQDEKLTVYGIVSTGLNWEFGKLETNVFTKHLLPNSISEPQKIFGNLDFIFAECEKQV
ncbi:MAG: hypothetical protein KAI83_18980 [Thiomargarita sp.]|nr:hypothetical protein [Thiomargarita sp.]